MGNVTFDILGNGPTAYRYVIELFNNDGPASSQELRIPACGSAGYDSEAFQDDTDAYILTVAENARSGSATVYPSRAPWTVVVTRTYVADTAILPVNPEVIA